MAYDKFILLVAYGMLYFTHYDVSPNVKHRYYYAACIENVHDSRDIAVEK